MAFEWEDEEEFRDIPDEVNGETPQPPTLVVGARQGPPVQLERRVDEPQFYEEPKTQQILEEVNESEDESFESVLADANLRIELASLYKMIMNHDLFDGLEVDQRAIDTVHRQIRRFARERMEIMLGMRQEVPKEGIVSSPFNDLEVVVLKKMASQMSKGVTESQAAQAPQPVAKVIARKEGLNTIGGSVRTQSAKPSAPVKKQSIKQPTAPLQKEFKSANNLVKESKPLEKQISEMTGEELLARNKEVKARQRGKKAVMSKTALPQPTYDQQEMLHLQRVGDHMNPGAVDAIMKALNKSKN